MYVKVLGKHNEGSNTKDPDALFEPTGEVMFGSAEVRHTFELLDLPFSTRRTYVGFIGDEVHDNEDRSEDMIWVNYAYWWDVDEGGIVSVVSSGDIFILNNNGKTIDRVQ